MKNSNLSLTGYSVEILEFVLVGIKTFTKIVSSKTFQSLKQRDDLTTSFGSKTAWVLRVTQRVNTGLGLQRIIKVEDRGENILARMAKRTLGYLLSTYWAMMVMYCPMGRKPSPLVRMCRLSAKISS